MAALAGVFVLAACSPRDDSLDPTVAPERTPSAATTATRQATERPAATEMPGDAAFDASRALEHVRVLSVDIGERLAGTEGEDQAVAYIRGELESYGYDVEVQPFEFSPERYGLAFVELPELDLAALRLDGSATGSVTGQAVYVGLGSQEDVDAVAVAGKIAIADRGVISFRAKYEAVLEAGALGLIVVNSEPGALPFADLDTRARFPVVAVPGETGEALMVVAAAEAVITIDAPGDGTGSSVNVVASAPGTERCEILVGGHHDTVPAAPGANDNASGVGHVLELARAMAADGMDEGLCFATFGAEEHGLFGSDQLARDLDSASELPEIMVNLDVTGIGGVVEVIGSERLRDIAIDLGSGAGIEVVRSQLPANAGSDHQSFQAQGVEVLFFTSGEFGTIHSPQDTFEALEADEMDRVGQVALLVLRAEFERIAGD
jgi:aminopeptidase YwaD